MSISLEESYRECGRIARRAAKNFYYSFLVMPREKRQAMCAIYAFMRRSDDIADSAANPAVALEGLRQWRSEVDAALAGKNSTHPILPALADAVRRYRIPQHHFHELLDGTEMDQTTTRYATFEDLYKYCYHVASAVGLVVLPVFGFKTKAALVPAEACGIAFQLTNILRDVKEDARMGRIYLPLEDLKRFGVSEEDIINSRGTPQFQELMRFEAARARGFYEKAQPLIGMIDADSRGTLAVMISIYGGLLHRMEANSFAVFDERVHLSAAEKLWIVLKNWGETLAMMEAVLLFLFLKTGEKFATQETAGEVVRALTDYAGQKLEVKFEPRVMNDPVKAAELCATKKPATGIVTPGFYLQYAKALQMEPLLETKRAGVKEERYVLVVRKDAGDDPGKLAGKTIATPLGNEQRYVIGVILQSKLGEEIRLKPVMDAEGAVFDLADGAKAASDAVLIEAGAWALFRDDPDLGSKLKVIYQSDEMPRDLVVAFGKADGFDANKLKTTLKEMTGNDTGKQILNSIRVECFVEIDRDKLAKAEKLFHGK